MTQHLGKRPPNRHTVPNITPEEKEKLHALYISYGAWTPQEAVRALGETRLQTFVQQELLGQQDTEMGPMYQLLAKGRFLATGTAGNASTLSAQLDLAYLRLCTDELQWEVLDESSPFYKHFDRFFPHSKFFETQTSFGQVMLGGKLSGGGYSVQGLEKLMRKVKSTALARNVLFVILTPHPRRGQRCAQTHQSVLRLVPHLPNIGAHTRHRFNPVTPEQQASDPGPILTSASAHRLRNSRADIPDLTLEILQLNLKARVEQAQDALDVDGALSHAQLAKYYGLGPHHLKGRLSTRAILRPSKNRANHEVQQQIVVANKKVAQLDDSGLNHRLTTAQLRLDLGVAADPQRWQVESRNALRLEDPDAVYITADGEQWAIEADTGHYELLTILRKLQTFKDQGYAQTIWGTPSDVRVKNLTRKIMADLRPALRLTEWWQ